VLPVQEESMPREAASAPQLPLFVRESSVAQEVLARDEAIRPVLTGQRSLPQQSQQTGINDWRLWRDLQRFQRRGLLAWWTGAPCSMRGAGPP
jgi:hypothetical protein